MHKIKSSFQELWGKVISNGIRRGRLREIGSSREP